MKVAVLLFPGTNDDETSCRAARAAGIDAQIVRWNAGVDLSTFEGFILPGGWSYEDRIRAGVIAAKDPVMAAIAKEAAAGKPVLGICNGAQILIESGLIPGISGKVEMALAPNRNPLIPGYYCAWTQVRTSGKSAFTDPQDGTLRIPIAHGEGRFTTKDPALIRTLKENGQIVLQYCTEDGTIDPSFPTNPNGAMENIAGIANPAGNVLAMMPHPERASWAYQLPLGTKSSGRGPCRIIFERMLAYMEARNAH